MPGRKKGRQRGASGSKAQSARKWNQAMSEAREDLAMDRKQILGRGGDAAPPRLSSSGFRSLATLLRQRARADELDAAAPPASASRSGPSAAPSSAAVKASYFSADLTEKHSRPRRNRTLLSFCIDRIGRDFLAYRADDGAVAHAFLLLPPACLSRLSRSASARGTVADHNISLLCSPGVEALWLRGRFTDEGAGAILPGLHTTGTSPGRARGTEGAIGLADVNRDREDGDGSGGEPRPASPQTAHGASEGGGGEEEWESANDRIESTLRGGVSLTSLDVSSPRITIEFIKRLVTRIPSLRRLGLRGSLAVVGGPDAVCDFVPRLGALRELDVSHCTWFCDITLRRLAKTFSLGGPPTRTDHYDGDVPDPPELVPAEPLDVTSGWGDASAPTTSIEAQKGD
eukprot:g8668.t1